MTTPSSFADRYGPWAIVTGAAQGIGAAYATELVARGVQVVAVDRTEIPAADGMRAVTADLAAPGGAEDVLRAVDGLDVGLLISNAAASWVGRFVDQSLEDALAMIDVNCRAPMVLVHTLLPRLVARGRGGIILMSSGSAQRGAPLVAGYAATKAWNRILAESLWDEVRDEGVDVLAVLPGSTRTPGWLDSMPQPSMGTANLMEPIDVAREALDALGTGPSLVCGQANREGEAFMASLDRAEAVRLMGEAMRTMYPPVRAADPTLR